MFKFILITFCTFCPLKSRSRVQGSTKRTLSGLIMMLVIRNQADWNLIFGGTRSKLSLCVLWTWMHTWVHQCSRIKCWQLHCLQAADNFKCVHVTHIDISTNLCHITDCQRYDTVNYLFFISGRGGNADGNAGDRAAKPVTAVRINVSLDIYDDGPRHYNAVNMTPLDLIKETSRQTISSHVGTDQNTCFKPQHDDFWTPTKW